jgi:hypothetical protein
MKFFVEDFFFKQFFFGCGARERESCEKREREREREREKLLGAGL